MINKLYLYAGIQLEVMCIPCRYTTPIVSLFDVHSTGNIPPGKAIKTATIEGDLEESATQKSQKGPLTIVVNGVI